MNISYHIEHIHNRYIVFKNNMQIHVASTKQEADNFIVQDKAKRQQYRVFWISKDDLGVEKYIDVEAIDEVKAKIKLQQLHMNEIAHILRTERLEDQ